MSVVLSEHLRLLSTAPEGIQKLRGLILELAVRGKLVPQDPSDEPASELLLRIMQEQARLEVGATRKRTSKSVVESNDPLSFDLPNGWASSALGDVINIVRGITFPTSEKSKLPEPGRVICLRTTNVQDKIEWEDVLYIRAEFVMREDQYLIANDIVMSMANSRELVGKVALADTRIDERVAFGGFLGVLRPILILPKFVMAFLRAPSIRSSLIDSASQTTNIANISLAKLRPLQFPIPPLAEQNRIVAKVDELMALCDRLETEQVVAESVQAKLVEILLGALTQSTEAADFAANWQLLAEHFGSIFTTECSLDALKQSILQLAVTGKLAAEGTQPWTTQRLDEICSEIVDCPHSTPKWTETGKICVRTSQFKPGKLDLSSSRFVSESTFKERISRLKPKPGDILYSREGGILGVACRVPLGVEICLGQRMMLLRGGSKVDSEFLEVVLNSPTITKLARQNTTGGAAPRVNVATVKAFPIPVPPLSEQRVIVGKVNELMALCDNLKANLAESRRHQERLASTLIESALKAA